MRRMLATGFLLSGIAVGALDGANHTAESGNEAERQPQQHHPWLRMQVLIEPPAEQQADADREAELETDRARRKGVVALPAFLRDRVCVHGLGMRVRALRILRHFAAMTRAGLHLRRPRTMWPQRFQCRASSARADLAAAPICSTSSSVCASDTKAASNCEGGRNTPISRMRRKYSPTRAVSAVFAEA